MSHAFKTKELQRKNNARGKLERFTFEAVVGCGMFGKVWKAKDKITKKHFAIKEIHKSV